MPRLLYLFALINLAIGSSAFVVGSILVPLSAGLGISASAAGQAMTAYALGSAVLAPMLLLATGRWPRKRALLVALALFGAGNVGCALAQDLPTLLAARVLMGAGSVFTPLAAGIAVTLVPVQRRGQALSLVFLGMSLSYVIGVPIGTWLGMRHGWQAPLWAGSIASWLAFAAVAGLVPRDIRAPGASFAGLGALLRRGEVQSLLGLSLLYFSAIFCVFSYIGPVLRALVPLSDIELSLTLMAFGLAGVCGTLSGGWANDRFGAERTLRAQLLLFLCTMAAVPLTQGSYPLLLLAFFCWGMAGFGMMAPQQARLSHIAPAQAPVLLSLNSSMMYGGMALGAVVGGAALPWTGFGALAWVGLPFAAAALGLLLVQQDARVQPA